MFYFLEKNSEYEFLISRFSCTHLIVFLSSILYSDFDLSATIFLFIINDCPLPPVIFPAPKTRQKNKTEN